MKICLICDVLGNENNGTTIATMNLYKSLISRGHEVRVVCSDTNRKDEPGYFVVPACNFGPFNSYVRKNCGGLAKPNTEILSKAMDGVDLVHVLLPLMLARRAVLIAKEKNIPITGGFHCPAESFTNHIMLMNSKLANNLTYKNFYSTVFSYCEAIHYPTQFIRDVFKNVIGKTNGYVISNGVNSIFKKIDAKKPDEFADKFVLLSIGRLSKEKSQSTIIKAVAKSKYNDKIQLLIAGGGPLLHKLEKLSKRLLVNPAIIKLYDRSKLVEVINYSDLYCHAAEIEIESIACIESFSCGLVPVISNSPRSATKTFALTPNNLFEYKNIKDLASKIDYWIEHPEEKQQLSNQYLDYSKQFEQDSCMDRMEQMMLNVVKNHNDK